MTTGAPMIDVMALTGNTLSKPGNAAITLHSKVNDIPIKIQAKISKR